MTRWIVGLGNPGRRFLGTRHNAGVWFVEHLAEVLGLSLRKPWLRPFFWAKIAVGENQLILLRPHVFMNVSATALAGLQRSGALNPETVLVVFDQMDLPPGDFRWKRKGSSGGHNGLKSLDSLFGGSDYARLALGIGRPLGDNVVEHVLGEPSAEDRQAIERAIRQVAATVSRQWADGWEELIHEVNGLRPPARSVPSGVSEPLRNPTA